MIVWITAAVALCPILGDSVEKLDQVTSAMSLRSDCICAGSGFFKVQLMELTRNAVSEAALAHVTPNISLFSHPGDMVLANRRKF